MDVLEVNKHYTNYRYTIPIPGGAKANIFIVEDREKPTMVMCNIGMVGTGMAGYGTSIARLLTDMLQAITLDEVIATMSELSLDLAEARSAKYKGEVCRSLPEAFAIALRNYRTLKAA